MATFVAAAVSAFGELAAAHGWSLGATSDEEWYARVEWRRGDHSFAVSYDRRDRFVQVTFERPATDEDVALRRLGVREWRRFGLPLWAVVEAAGGLGSEVLAAGDESRVLAALPRLAAATARYAGGLLAGDWSVQDAASTAVARNHSVGTEEARRARRFLP